MAKWYVTLKSSDFRAVAGKYHIDPVIARIIRNRDLTEDKEIEQYLHGSVSELSAPEQLKDLNKAVAIIEGKIKEKKSIRIIGDYDVDGICATCILYRSLKECGALVDTKIPHRIKDGYGLNESMIDDAIDEEIDTILTCDNGIAAKDAIDRAKEHGLGCVITDHHEIPFTETENGKEYLLPDADAIVDPRQEDCHYPFPDICGAFVAYQFAKKLMETMLPEGSFTALLEEMRELAGVATVCDVMPLRGENRILVKETLESLKHAKNIGLRALMKVNEISTGKVSSYVIGFVLGPCINATGRLDTAKIALELLEAGSMEEAVPIAARLKELNEIRQDMTKKGVEEALAEAEKEEYRSQKVLVLYLPDVHESLAGIIAGKVREKTGKPTFVLTDGQDCVKGSARSIEEYSMYDEMVKCRELFLKFGGHRMAAGLSLKKENVDAFREQINQNCRLTEEDLEEKIKIDLVMPMAYVTKEFIHQLEVLEPFGTGNAKPVFAQKNVKLSGVHNLGKHEDMVGMTGEDENHNHFNLVMFRNGKEFLRENPEVIDIIYEPSLNEFRGRESIQFIVQDYKKVK